MPPLTTIAAVKLVLSTSLTDDEINQFIADADLWVTEELGNESLSAGRMEIVERYLTCALIRTRDLGLKSANFDGVAESYQVDPTVTDYLLRAASFDTSGMVRRFFLAPKTTRQAQWRTPVSFRDEELGSGPGIGSPATPLPPNQ